MAQNIMYAPPFPQQFPQQFPPQQGMSGLTKLAIAAGIALLLFLIVSKIYESTPLGTGTGTGSTSPSTPTPTPTPPPPKPPVVKPNRPADMIDCGYPDRPRGWYDMEGRGYRNDFCRHIGDYPGWWACTVQGRKNPDGSVQAYSDRGVYQYDASEPFDPYTGTLSGWNCS